MTSLYPVIDGFGGNILQRNVHIRPVEASIKSGYTAFYHFRAYNIIWESHYAYQACKRR